MFPLVSLFRRGALTPLLLLLAAAPASAASTLHVSPTGTGDCGAPSRACTLGVALAAAGADDHIALSAGTHAPPQWLQDRAAAPGVVIEPAAGLTVRPVLDLSGGSLKLVHGTGLRGVDVVTGSGRALLVQGGLLEGLRIQTTGSHTVGVELGEGAVLRNSTVTTSGQEAAAVVITAWGVPAELRGVTVLASGEDAVAMRVTPDPPRVTARVRAVNAIVRGVGSAQGIVAAAYAPSSAEIVLDHVATDPARTVADGSGVAITAPGLLQDPPQFVSRATGDLRQTATSTTIDAGTADVDGDGVVDAADARAAGAFDLDGSPRRLGTPDLGADEREMPPIVVGAQAEFTSGKAVAAVRVQPRGLPTSVAADWAFDDGAATRASAVTAEGNDLVTVHVPLGRVPAGAKRLTLAPSASNAAGSTSAPVSTEAVPAEHVPPADPDPELDEPTIPGPPTPLGRTLTPGPRATPTPTPTPLPGPRPTSLPGALPVLASPSATLSGTAFALRLRCRGTVSCRGSVVLTRLGAARTTTFKIPPGKDRLARITLTTAQAARVRRAGPKGVRGLLELRSLDQGSTFTAVRLKAAGR